MKKLLTAFIAFSALNVQANPQLSISPQTNATQMANAFIFSGVTASNATYSGSQNTFASFSNGSSTNLGLPDGIILTTGIVNGNPALSSPHLGFSSTSNSTPGDIQLNGLIPGFSTYDASVFEFDLVPAGNILEFQYVFASEEYPEFAGSSFNDVFGFFISGADPNGGSYNNLNIALLAGSATVVCINNINNQVNSSFYVDNAALNGQTIVFDGFTTVLTAQVAVTAGQSYHLKIALADAGDEVYDSAIFLKAQSMKSYVITGSEALPAVRAFAGPNPVVPASVLCWQMKNSGKYILRLADVSGREVFNSDGTAVQGNASVSLYELTRLGLHGIFLLKLQTPDGLYNTRIYIP